MGDPEARCRILFVDHEPRILEGLRRVLQGTRNERTMTFVASAAKALDLSPIMSATGVRISI